MATTPNGLPYPVPTDAPNGPAELQTLATKLDPYVPQWATPPYQYRVQSTGLSIPTSTYTTVLGWAGVQASGPSFYTGSGIWTIVLPGWYDICGQIAYPPVATPGGQRVVRLMVNSTIVDEFSARADQSFNTGLPFAHGQKFLAGDTISVVTYQSQGVSQTTATGAGLCHISIKWSGAVA